VEDVTIVYNNDGIAILAITERADEDYEYIKPKVVVYHDKLMTQAVIDGLSDFDEVRVQLPTLALKLAEVATQAVWGEFQSMTLQLKSNNENKSSRNKTILKAHNIEHFERTVVNVGKKDVKHLRIRQN